MVTEDSLTQCMVDIRRTLGSDGGKFVRTVPRRGYIFDPPPEPETGQGVGTAAAQEVATATVRRKVRPAWILNLLAQSPALRVIARTSSFSFKGQPVAISVIADKLGVTHVLEGSVRRSGSRVRVTAQLVDAGDSSHLWSQIYERDLSAENLFAIQSEIATSIAEVLQARLLPGEQPHIGTIPTRNLDAYDAYLFGRRLLATRDYEKYAEARRYFSRAIELDPDFALGYVPRVHRQSADGCDPGLRGFRSASVYAER